jgi:hypothetical protein
MLEINEHIKNEPKNSNNYCFSLVVTVIFIIVFFEVLPEKSVWSIPVIEAEEHINAVPASGGFSLLLMQKQEAYKTITKEQELKKSLLFGKCFSYL